MNIAAMLIVAFLSSIGAANNVVLHDSSRNRDIPVKVYYPASQTGSLPLIVFSHGFGGTKDGYEYLGRGWAQAGYVVVFPTHPGSDHAALGLRALRTARDPIASFKLQMDRVQDISFVLSSLDVIEQAVPELKGKIDKKRIGVGGHSMGAGTALLEAGATASTPGSQGKSFRDNRVTAVVAMSPQGAGEEGFDEHSWDDLHIPIMTMSGTQDFGVGGESASWRQEAFAHMPSGDKYQVMVQGARHLSFAIGRRFHDCILAESIAFWDRYLKQDSGSKAKIQSVGACDVKAK